MHDILLKIVLKASEKMGVVGPPNDEADEQANEILYLKDDNMYAKTIQKELQSKCMTRSEIA